MGTSAEPAGGGGRWGTPSEAGFDSFYAHYHGKLRSYCRRIVGDGPTADDVVQECLFRAWLHRDQIRQQAPSWLRRVAYNLCIDVIRARSRVVPAGEHMAEEAVEDDAGRELERREQAEAVREALTRVTPRHKELLELRDVEGVGYDVLARRLGVSEVGVRAVLLRARRSLRSALAGAAA